MSGATPAASKDTRKGSPLAELTPAGLRILKVARKIVAKGGLTALSLQAVATGAKVHKSAIGYHFGGKQGLVNALLAWLEWEGDEQAWTMLGDRPPGADRFHAYLEFYRWFAANEEYWRLAFALLPARLGPANAGALPADVFTRMYNADFAVLGLDDSEQDETKGRAHVLLSVVFAALEGLAFQRIVLGDRLALGPCFELLESAILPIYEQLLANSGIDS